MTRDSVMNVLGEKLILAAENGRLPEVKLPEDRPPDLADFKGRATISAKAIAECLELLKKYEQEKNNDDLSSDKCIVKETLVPLLLLCGEHTEVSKVFSQSL